MALQTSEVLDQQDTQIDRIDKNLDVIDQNNKKAKYLIKGLTSSWGYVRNLFSKAPKENVQEPEQTIQIKQVEKEDWQVVESQPMAAPLETVPGLKKQDQQIDLLINQVRSIKYINENIGEQIRSQNQKLDRLNERIARTDQDMKAMDKSL